MNHKALNPTLDILFLSPNSAVLTHKRICAQTHAGLNAWVLMCTCNALHRSTHIHAWIQSRHRHRLPAPLTPILQPPKQQPAPLAESFCVIFSATVVVETAEKCRCRRNKCDSESEHEPRKLINRMRGESLTNFSLIRVWCPIKKSWGGKVLAFQRQSPSVWVCEIVNILCVCIQCMCVCSDLCAQCIAVTVSNCWAWVLRGNTRLIWMTHEKAVIFQQRHKTKRRRIRMWGYSQRGAEIWPNSKTLPSQFQSWLSQIMLSFLCWHIGDGFISLCKWMGV